MYKEESAQPVNGEGRRFIECPYYGDCLMHAAKHNWNAWTCAKCPNLRLDELCKRIKFISPYYQLLSEIYPEFKRKYEPAMSLLDLEHWRQFSPRQNLRVRPQGITRQMAKQTG